MIHASPRPWTTRSPASRREHSRRACPEGGSPTAASPASNAPSPPASSGRQTARVPGRHSCRQHDAEGRDCYGTKQQPQRMPSRGVRGLGTVDAFSPMHQRLQFALDGPSAVGDRAETPNRRTMAFALGESDAARQSSPCPELIYRELSRRRRTGCCKSPRPRGTRRLTK
jgi:hypothetical protein